MKDPLSSDMTYIGVTHKEQRNPLNLSTLKSGRDIRDGLGISSSATRGVRFFAYAKRKKKKKTGGNKCQSDDEREKVCSTPE